MVIVYEVEIRRGRYLLEGKNKLWREVIGQNLFLFIFYIVIMEPKGHQLELTPNGIIYISSGFDGPYTLQVITLKQQTSDQFIFCLTDGKLYIGGRYTGKLSRDITQYSVVSIEGRFISKWLPMIITSISCISNRFNYLLGDAPITLHDYFTEQAEKQEQRSLVSTSRSQMGQSLTNKKRNIVKISQQDNTGISKPRQKPEKEQKTQKRLKLEQDSESQQSKIETQKYKSMGSIGQKINQNVERIIENKKMQSPIKMYPPKIQHSEASSAVTVARNVFNEHKGIISQKKVFTGEDEDLVMLQYEQVNNVYLDDLYERMPGWKIVCRVNFLRAFISAKGKKCLSLQLIDEHGCQRKAMYYFGTKGITLKQDSQTINQGKIYSFSGGQIIQPSGQTKLPLQIIFTESSQVKLYQNIKISPFLAKKIIKLSFLSQLENDTEVSVMGIISKLQILVNEKNKNIYNTDNQKIKAKGVVCDPKEQIQVEFSKTCFNSEKLPKEGDICVLHYFKVSKSNNTIKLSGNNHLNRAYFSILEADEFPQENKKISSEELMFRQMKGYFLTAKNSSELRWKQIVYYDLSEIRYKKRTIKEILQVLNMTDAPVFSEVLCSVSTVKVKRQYMGCPICKRATHQGEAYLWHCIKCSTMVEPVPTLILLITLSDSTASLMIEVIGDKSEQLLGISGKQFKQLNEQQQECHLQMVCFQNFLVKLKTQKSKFGEISSILQDLTKQEHKMVVDEIRRRTIDEKLRCDNIWENASNSLQRK